MELEYQYEYPGVDQNNSVLTSGAVSWWKRPLAYIRENLGQYGLYLANNLDKFENFTNENPVMQFIMPHEESEAAVAPTIGNIEGAADKLSKVVRKYEKSGRPRLPYGFRLNRWQPLFLELNDKISKVLTDLRIMGKPSNLSDEEVAIQILTDEGKELLSNAKAELLFDTAVSEGRRFLPEYADKTKAMFRRLADDWYRITYPDPKLLQKVAEINHKAFKKFTRENRASLVQSQISSLPQGKSASQAVKRKKGWAKGVKLNTGGTLNYLNYIS